jgi:SNF2 family DNA or RNA helicase
MNKRIQVTPWSGRIPYPLGLDPLPFQCDAVRFVLSRPVSYLAADAGTGKTIIAALVINAVKRPVVYLCPPFLVLNTKVEMEKWNTWGARVAIFGQDNRIDFHPDDCDVLIVPDSQIAGERSALKTALNIKREQRALLFVDEAHRYKNIKSSRTKAMLWRMNFGWVCFMSGTPLPNGRPMELYPILNRFAPDLINHMSHHQFGMRYCGGYLNDFGYYEYSGRSNVDELFSRMRESFMLRIKKRDVLDLLPRTTEMVVLAENLPTKIAKLERRMLEQHSPETLASEGMDSTYFRLLGQAKAKLAVPYIKDVLSETDECALVFARHLDVVDQLTKGLAKYKPLVITGAVPKAKRNELVHRFQTTKENRVFILNQEAGGVGFTLTKANLVFQVEPNWVPGLNDQATDRADRIGQTRIVHERYLVFRNSMDRVVLESNLTKRNTINKL